MKTPNYFQEQGSGGLVTSTPTTRAGTCGLAGRGRRGCRGLAGSTETSTCGHRMMSSVSRQFNERAIMRHVYELHE